MRTLLLCLSLPALLGAGCASAGPVVANVSWDASGALLVEKCKVHTNFFWMSMELTECRFHLLRIVAPEADYPAPRLR